MSPKKPLLKSLDEYFDDESHKMYVAVDCVIFGFDGTGLNLLLMKRTIEPFAGQWSLIGSFVQLDESISEAAQRILYERTGLNNLYLQQHKVYGRVGRDPGYRCVSLVYYALIRSDNFEQVVDFDTQWFAVENLPELVLDHRTMVDEALESLKKLAKHDPFGFELLPLRFTIPQLQTLFEALYQKKLDGRNFRKKILSLEILKEIKEKDKTGSKKGAWLYEFDRQKYARMISDGRAIIL